MLKKYDMIEENGLFRVVARRDFGRVKESMVGGLIASENNLSHEGNCWIDYNSTILDNAMVRGNAIIEESVLAQNAIVDGNAVIRMSTIEGESYVSDDAGIYDSYVAGRASITKSITVTNGAVINQNAIVYGKFTINGGHITETTTQTPIILSGMGEYDVTIMDKHISIGCISRSVDKWRKFTLADAKKFEKEGWRRAVKTFNELKPILELILDTRTNYQKGLTNQ